VTEGCSLTVLRCKGRNRATKTIERTDQGWATYGSVSLGTTFWVSEVPVASFVELAAVLSSLTTEGLAFVVRGEPVPGIDRQNAARLLNRQGDGTEPTFRDVPRRWLAIDCDKVPAPPMLDAALEPEEAVEHLIGLLPDEFRDACCWWQLTGSQLPGAATISARLWFWLSEPIDSPPLRRWAEAANKAAGVKVVDPALYNGVQPHFTANPRVVRGTDPVARRHGVRLGLVDEVRIALPSTATQSTGASLPAPSGGGGFKRHLARIGGPAGFHRPIGDAVMAFVRAHGVTADHDVSPAVEAIRDRVRSAPPGGRSPATINAYASDGYLRGEFTRAIARMQAESAPQTAPPTYPPAAAEIALARSQLRDEVAAFKGEVRRYWTHQPERQGALDFNTPAQLAGAPPMVALPVGVGIGKTAAAREMVADLLTEFPSRRVVFSVPLHDLANEQAAVFDRLGIDAMVWRGRTAPDPEIDGATMCRDLDAVRDAIAIGVEIETSVCRKKTKKGEELCAFYGTCGYQRQKELAADAEVIVVTHATLFHERPKRISEVGLIVLDEGFWKDGLRGVSSDVVAVTIDDLDAPVFIRKSDGDTEDLTTLRRRLAGVLRDLPDGPVSQASLGAAGITGERATYAARLEWARLEDVPLVPGMTAEQRKEVMARFGHRPAIRAAIQMWQLIAEALAAGHDPGGLSIETVTSEAGTTRRVRLAWRADFSPSWVGEQTAILHLDATMRAELVRAYLPNMRFAEPVESAAPYATVRQIVKAPTTAKRLAAGRSRQELTEDALPADALREVRAFIYERARALRGRGRNGVDLLVVAQKGAVEALKALGLPKNVEVGNFNGIAGLDRWGDVAGAIFLGRTLPGPEAVERQALALTNCRGAVIDGGEAVPWYPRIRRAIALRDGLSVGRDGEVHPDPMAEAIRWSICEGELVQAIGRVRAVNRTADNPVEIDILADVVLPITVDRVETWTSIDRVRQMAGDGVWLESATDRARARPDLWTTEKAARLDDARGEPHSLIEFLSNKEMRLTSWRWVRYRLAGAGQRPRRAAFDLVDVPDPRAWIEAWAGPLALYEVTAAPEDSTGADTSREVTAEPARSYRPYFDFNYAMPWPAVA
jgi:putative DNA primase/helicase